MTLFATPRRKLARQTAQHLVSGHCALLAWWALKNAGVCEALRKEGVDAAKHAAAANMAPDVLEALLDYLAQQQVLARTGTRYTLAPAGEALLEHEEGVLDLVRAYQPVLQTLEHLLARLKTYGGGVARRADVVSAGEAQRYEREVFPALHRTLESAGVTQMLDLNCGGGELLTYLATQRRNLVGVGIAGDGGLARQANDLIDQLKLEKRLIAIPANPVHVCTETRRTFERIGVSLQLWEKFDGVLAVGLFSALQAQGESALTDVLQALPRNFPHAALVVAEPCAAAGPGHGYYAAELQLLGRLSHSEPRPAAAWAELLTGAGYTVAETTALHTDGVTLFVCPAPKKRRKGFTPAERAAAAAKASEERG